MEMLAVGVGHIACSLFGNGLDLLRFFAILLFRHTYFGSGWLILECGMWILYQLEKDLTIGLCLCKQKRYYFMNVLKSAFCEQVNMVLHCV